MIEQMVAPYQVLNEMQFKSMQSEVPGSDADPAPVS